MIRTWNLWLEMTVMGVLLFGMSGTAAAQSGQGSQSQPPAQQTDKPKTSDITPLTLDAPPPVSAEEEEAYKAFQAAPQSDMNKKISMGEAFVQKYPQSRYRTPVYGALAYGYLQLGQTQKMQEYGEKAIEANPNDVTTLALLGQTLSRLHGSPAEAAQMLAKAEQYSKRAIEITPTLPKPENLTDEVFASAKNQTLAMAHSGLGLVFIKRGKNAEAISELEQAVKIDPNPDPVNYYLLGMADKSASHFDDAVAALNKCAAMAGQLQGTCKTLAEEAKKLGATQLSAPK